MKHLFAVRNVAAHAEEMEEPAPRQPVFFQKPASCFQDPPELTLPTDIGRIEFEVELAVRIDQALSRATAVEAAEAIDAAGIVLDLTARDLQSQRKEESLPWFEAKGFDGAGVLGPFVDLDELGALPDQEVRLTVNGEPRQAFPVAGYAVGPAQLLAQASRWVRLEPGDILGCGTGSGVGPLHQDDELVAALVGQADTLLEATVTQGPTA